MSKTLTTLSVAIAGPPSISSVPNAETWVTPASMTGIVAPGPNKSNRVILWIEREALEVVAVSATQALCVRGVMGTQRANHAAGALIYVGHEQDFYDFVQDESNDGPGTYSQRSVAFETAQANAVTDTLTLTPEELLQGLVVGTPTAAANYTLPKAADLIAALQDFGNPFIGQSFEFDIINKSGGANTITVVTNTGVTTNGTLTIAQNFVRRFRVIITDPVALTYSIYSLGTAGY